MAEDLGLGIPPTQRPQGIPPKTPWVNIILSAVVVVALIIMSVTVARTQGGLSDAISSLNTQISKVSEELTGIKASVIQSSSSIQNEIGGLSTNIVNAELMANELLDRIDALTGEISTLAIAVAGIEAQLAAGNWTGSG